MVPCDRKPVCYYRAKLTPFQEFTNVIYQDQINLIESGQQHKSQSPNHFDRQYCADKKFVMEKEQQKM